MTLLSLDKPDKLPTEAESKIIIAKAISQSIKNTYSPTFRQRLVRKLKVIVSPHDLRVVGEYQQNAFAEIFASEWIGLELAVACSTTELESKGLNIYGADPASAWMNDGPFGTLWENIVTKASYQWFGARVDSGYTSNGVGPKQLTSRSLQLAADARGGCWKPEHNMATGDMFFLSLLRQSGSIWEAAYLYNGSGQAAENYANEFVNLVSEWRQRLA